MDINKIKEELLIAQGRLSQLHSEKIESLEAKKYWEKKQELLLLAQSFLQNVAQTTQENLKFQIEDIVNLALETCFSNEYEFKINFEFSRGKVEAKLTFVSKISNCEIEPMLASGGGVLDIAGFALRLACYSLQRGKNNVIVLDEPFRFLSVDLRNSACELIKKLSEKLNLQVIMITHMQEFIDIANKVFEVKKLKNGHSKIINVEV